MSPGQKRETKPRPRTDEHVSSPSDSQLNEQKSKSQLKREAVQAAAKDKLAQEMDELVDEIDELLVENAEEFIKSYVQKGGE